eukprot:UN07206
MSSMIGGIFIELMTILHPEIGNFWHSQATIMLVDKHEPFYMLFGVYIWFNVVPVLWAENLSSGWFVKCCYTALFGGFLFGVLDIVGIQYLWWTWHNTEPIYDGRYFGVPVASTFWMCVSQGSLSFTSSMFKKYVNT